MIWRDFGEGVYRKECVYIHFRKNIIIIKGWGCIEGYYTGLLGTSKFSVVYTYKKVNSNSRGKNSKRK